MNDKKKLKKIKIKIGGENEKGRIKNTRPTVHREAVNLYGSFSKQLLRLR
jgi:hypothetical protein